MNKILTEAELQHIEHCNKVLREHKELVELTVNETERLFDNYLPVLTEYINHVVEVRTKFGNEVSHIIQSSRSLGIVTGKVADVINFCSAIEKLDKLLTNDLVEKLRRITDGW